MQDIQLGIDPVLFVGVRDGECTAPSSSGSLYIANPQGASQSFDVEVQAQTSR